MSKCDDEKIPEPDADRRVEGLNDVSFADKVTALLEKAESAGLKVAVVEGTRSAERQRWLYDHELSAQDGKRRRSSHQYGTGVDVAFVDERGELSWSEDEDWQTLGEIAEAVGLSWGGRWTKPVLSHFQEEDPFVIQPVDKGHHRFGGASIIANCGGACSTCSSSDVLDIRTEPFGDRSA